MQQASAPLRFPVRASVVSPDWATLSLRCGPSHSSSGSEGHPGRRHAKLKKPGPDRRSRRHPPNRRNPRIVGLGFCLADSPLGTGLLPAAPCPTEQQLLGFHERHQRHLAVLNRQRMIPGGRSNAAYRIHP